jgi:hypothetical protein
MINIRAVQNGYVISYKDPETEDGVVLSNTIERVYAIDDSLSQQAEVFALQPMFYDIMEVLGVYNSKHNDHNLRINVINRNGKPVDERGIEEFDYEDISDEEDG